MKKYIYFIAYVTRKGDVGNLEVPLEGKITGIRQIIEVETYIANALDDKVTITNFKLLRVEK